MPILVEPAVSESRGERPRRRAEKLDRPWRVTLQAANRDDGAVSFLWAVLRKIVNDQGRCYGCGSINCCRRGRAGDTAKECPELHGGKDGMRASMQIADAVEPFDHQGKKNEEPVHQHAVGVVMLNVLHPVKILGLIESLVLDFPAALGQFEERPGGEFGDGKLGEPIGLDDRSVLFM